MSNAQVAEESYAELYAQCEELLRFIVTVRDHSSDPALVRIAETLVVFYGDPDAEMPHRLLNAG